MTTSDNKYDPIEALIFQQGLKIKSIDFQVAENKMIIHLNGDLALISPIKFFKGLSNATPKQLADFRIIGSGTGIHWPLLDEDLSLKGFLKEYLRQQLQMKTSLTIS